METVDLTRECCDRGASHAVNIPRLPGGGGGGERGGLMAETSPTKQLNQLNQLHQLHQLHHREKGHPPDSRLFEEPVPRYDSVSRPANRA